MTPLELAKAYMKIFFDSKNFEELKSIFSENLDFKGPLFQSYSAQEYIDSLLASPPVDSEYQIIQAYEDSQSACLVYKFFKENRETLMSQVFWVANGRIEKIRLVFNPQDIC